MEYLRRDWFAQFSKGRRQRFVFALAIFLGTTLISVSSFVAYSASSLSPRTRPNWLIHPKIIYSPFTLHRGNAFQGATDRLQVPVYAGAIPLEVSTFAWNADQSSSASATGLALVRLQVKVPLSLVNSWYQENFPKPYSQLRKEQILGGPAKEQWFQKLDIRVNDETTLYQATDSNRVRGVVIESSDNSSSEVTLFYYSEGR
ncbi:MAG: hypothetical protein ACHQLQ_09305 [Candidatus Acidiferrales bacterium]